MNTKTVVLLVAPTVMAIVAYLLQVDPLSLCKGGVTVAPQEQVEKPSTADAGQN